MKRYIASLALATACFAQTPDNAIRIEAQRTTCVIAPVDLTVSIDCSNGRRDDAMTAPDIFHADGVFVLLKSVSQVETEMQIAYTDSDGNAVSLTRSLGEASVLLSKASGSAPRQEMASADLNSTGAKRIVVAVSNFAQDAVQFVDSENNEWTRIAAASGYSNVALYYADNPKTSAMHMFGCIGNYCTIAVAAFSGTSASVSAVAFRAAEQPTSNGTLIEGLTYEPAVRMGLAMAYSMESAPMTWTGAVIDSAVVTLP